MIDIDLAQRFVDQIDFSKNEIKRKALTEVSGVNELFRLLRVVNNIRSKELAHALGVSHGQLSHMEQGRNGVTEKMMIKYADFFNLDRDSVLRLARQVKAERIQDRFIVAMKMAEILKEKA